MSGETEEQVSGWTVDTLHSHLWSQSREADKRYEQRFDAQEKAVQAALASAKEAVTKAETAYDKRFEGVNEFRATLADQARDLMPRKESELQHAALLERVAALESLVRDQVSRGAGMKDGWGYLAGALGALAGVAGVVIAAR